MKVYHFYTLKELWDSQGDIKIFHGMPRVKKQLSEKRYIEHLMRLNTSWSSEEKINHCHGQDLLAEKTLNVTLNDINSRIEVRTSS